MATGLQQAHLARILRDPNLLEDMQENLFQNVRILVVGKSGCGKSTLIRLMMEEGAMRKMHQELPITSDRSSLSSSLTAPAARHDGRAGVQDVWREWKHPDVPITFHDTNGMDNRGASRLHDIKDFLEMRQRGTKSTSFVERVHLVWYVVQSTDNRVAEDGGLMKLISGYDIPMLLVMTHKDAKADLKKSSKQSLLKLVGNSSKAAFLEDHLVRVGNDVEEGILDLKGLRRLNQETQELLQEQQKFTWAAAQAIDMESKLAQSAELIVKLKRSSILSGFFLAAIPAAHQSTIIALFIKIHHGLCRIWQVPRNLESALWSCFFVQESGHYVMRRLIPNLVAAAALGVAVASTVLTAGMAAPLVAGVMLPAGMRECKATPTIFMTYSLLVLGGILHVQCENGVLGGWSKHVDTPVETFSRQCVTFSTSTNYKNQLLPLVRKHRCLWDSVARTNSESEVIKNQIIDFYKHLVKTRPDSFFTLIRTTEEKDVEHSPNMPLAQTNIGGYNMPRPSKHSPPPPANDLNKTSWKMQNEDYDASFNNMESTMWTPESHQDVKHSPSAPLARENSGSFKWFKSFRHSPPPFERNVKNQSLEIQNEDYDASFNNMESTMWTPESQDVKHSPSAPLAQENSGSFKWFKSFRHSPPPFARNVKNQSLEIQNEVSPYDDSEQNPPYNDDNDGTNTEDSSTTFM